MPKYLINGGKKLIGQIDIPTSKNAILPIMAGTILCTDEVVLRNTPCYSDIQVMSEILESLGAVVTKEKDTLIINPKNINNYIFPSELASKLRSSIFTLGAILGRLKKAKIAYPGGCEIGNRPIDLHIKALKKLGVSIIDKHGFLDCKVNVIKPCYIHLDFPSVGATENVILASVISNGTTIIKGAAREPEVEDLCSFLNKMGARIFGAGSDEIVIDGVHKLNGGTYKPIPDRIVAGTYLLAPIMCGGKVELCGVQRKHIEPLIYKLENIGCNLRIKSDKILVESSSRPKCIPKIETLPYPGFPTDMQPQMVSLASVSTGSTIIIENLFENRFKYVRELNKMGADVVISGKVAIVRGKKELFGAEVESPDLRGGAALVLAGLVANGYTSVSKIEYIERGYDNMVDAFKSLGAEIKREE